MGSDPTGPATVAGPDLRQMRYIVKVAELGGFTAAAAELHVAQQAVSQQVRATERMLGVTLFRRAPRAVTPTPAGEVFVREAKRGAHRSRATVRTHPGGGAGRGWPASHRLHHDLRV